MSSFLSGENSVFAREIEVMMILYLSEIRSGHAAKVFTELFYDPSINQGILACCSPSKIILKFLEIF
jgi:hypothetical protein